MAWVAGEARRGLSRHRKSGPGATWQASLGERPAQNGPLSLSQIPKNIEWMPGDPGHEDDK